MTIEFPEDAELAKRIRALRTDPGYRQAKLPDGMTLEAIVHALNTWLTRDCVCPRNLDDALTFKPEE